MHNAECLKEQFEPEQNQCAATEELAAVSDLLPNPSAEQNADKTGKASNDAHRQRRRKRRR